ncbi:hypothetical protein PENSPDRAFT_693382, partial [Peniophora sp. CONT]
MFGFAKLFTVGALATSAFAAPLLDAALGADADVLGLVGAKVGAAAHARDIAEVEAGAAANVLGLVGLKAGVDAEVGRRDDATKSLQSVIADLSSQLNPVVAQITALTGTGKTVDEISAAVAPLTSQAVTILSGAVSEVQSLSGLPIEQILASVDGGATLVVGDVAKLLADVLTLVLGAVGTLLGAVHGDVSSLLAALAPLV